ncbi:MAG: hypothetical protein K940chlam3_01564 [Chlamydiae bacterium]|nr:hypothetical protein [Chlamydiota bacterium]
MRYILFLSLLTLFTGCAMPGDECWSTTPMTNNPNVMNQRGDSAIPGVNQ